MPSGGLAGHDSVNLELAIELTQMDVIRSHLRTLIALPAIRLALATLGLVLAASMLIWLRSLARPDSNAQWLVPALLLLACVVPLSRIIGRARQHYAEMSVSERQGYYRLDEQGISWTLGRAPGSRRWEQIQGFDESAGYVFIHESLGVIHALPKRCMDVQQQVVLR